MIGKIEQAVIDHLTAAGKREGLLGYAFRQVESLPLVQDEDLAAQVRAWPAAWTTFSDWRKLEDLSHGGALVALQFHVIVAAQNVRNAAAARLGVRAGEGGDYLEVGSYQLAVDVAGLLMGQDFGLPIRNGLVIGDCKPVFIGSTKGRNLSLFAVAFTAEVELEPNVEFPDPRIGDFETFNVNWDLPPHGNVTGGLPADATADANTRVTLPTQENP